MSLFNAIKSQLAILDIVREYTTLTRAGSYWRGRCPLHTEKTASFTISEHKQIFYCFGCNTGGDIIKFIEKKENCSALEAAHFLIERYNLSVPESNFTYSTKQTVDEKKRYFLLHELVAQWCHTSLLNNKAVAAYLEKRGITKNSVLNFHLGYFPGGLEGVNQLLEWMRRNACLAEDLIDINFLIKGKNALYSPFEERILFPIRDHLGRLCGFGGRIFKENDTRTKYYNSRENNHFIKGSLLFGLDHAKQAIQKHGTAFLVEGYTDCIAMVQHGYNNTVATLGTACTQEHLATLVRYAMKLYVIYDGDRAGKDAVMRLTKLCWSVDMELYSINLPPGQDPAALLAQGASLDPFIAQAQDIFLFFIHTIATDFSQKPLSQKLSLTRELLAIIASLNDPLKQSLLLDRAATILNLPISSLQQELNRMQKSLIKEPEQAEVAAHESTVAATTLAPLEKKIFCSIMHNMQSFSQLDTAKQNYLMNNLCEPLAYLLKRLHSCLENGSTDFFLFFDGLDEAYKLLVSHLITQQEEVDSVQELEKLIEQLQKKQWKAMVHSMREQVEAATRSGDNEKAARIIKEFLMLKERYYTTVSH